MRLGLKNCSERYCKRNPHYRDYREPCSKAFKAIPTCIYRVLGRDEGLGLGMSGF